MWASYDTVRERMPDEACKCQHKQITFVLELISTLNQVREECGSETPGSGTTIKQHSLISSADRTCLSKICYIFKNSRQNVMTLWAISNKTHSKKTKNKNWNADEHHLKRQLGSYVRRTWGFSPEQVASNFNTYKDIRLQWKTGYFTVCKLNIYAVYLCCSRFRDDAWDTE